MALSLAAQRSRKMFAFNDSAAAAAAAAAAMTIREDEAAAVVPSSAADSNLTRTAQLEDAVQLMLDSWRYQVKYCACLWDGR